MTLSESPAQLQRSSRSGAEPDGFDASARAADAARPVSPAARESEAARAARARLAEPLDQPFATVYSAYGRWGKRLANLVLLVLVLPVALLLAIPIVLVNAVLFRDPRRIFFRQERVGRGGAVFRIWKFRTMREEHSRAGHEGSQFHSWKNGYDRLRVTAFGRFLRNTHLDGFPQLVNVLLGEMDFVGPRPEMVEIHRWACADLPGFERRNDVRPGITGLAQITQGYAVMDGGAYAAKLAADLAYISNMSLRGDLVIVLRTLVWMLEGKGWRRKSATQALPASQDIGRAAGNGTMTPCPAPASSPTRATSSTTRARDIRNDPVA